MKLSSSECVNGTSPRLEVSLGVYCTRTYISPALTTNGCKSRLKLPPNGSAPANRERPPAFLRKKLPLYLPTPARMEGTASIMADYICYLHMPLHLYPHL